MKLPFLALVASLAVAGYADAQTPDQSIKPPAATPPASSGASKSIGHACKKEVKKLCGKQAHGQEMQNCIKANIDSKKFSSECQAELMGAKKPPS